MSSTSPLPVTHPTHVAFEAHWKELGLNEKKVRDELFGHIIFSDIPPVSRRIPTQLYPMHLHFSLYIKFSQPLSQHQLAK